MAGITSRVRARRRQADHRDEQDPGECGEGAAEAPGDDAGHVRRDADGGRGHRVLPERGGDHAQPRAPEGDRKRDREDEGDRDQGDRVVGHEPGPDLDEAVAEQRPQQLRVRAPDLRGDPLEEQHQAQRRRRPSPCRRRCGAAARRRRRRGRRWRRRRACPAPPLRRPAAIRCPRRSSPRRRTHRTSRSRLARSSGSPSLGRRRRRRARSGRRRYRLPAPPARTARVRSRAPPEPQVDRFIRRSTTSDRRASRRRHPDRGVPLRPRAPRARPRTSRRGWRPRS